MLPDCNIKNFTSDWNNGIHLSALLDYCRYSFEIYIYTNLYLHIISISIYIYIYNYLQARADAELAAPQPRQRAGQRAAGDGDRGEGVQDTHGARAGPLRQVGEKYWEVFVESTKNICSPHLDELSGMTYLSYFMKEEDSPGYYSTLNWVKNQIPNFRINNFRVSLSLPISIVPSTQQPTSAL